MSTAVDVCFRRVGHEDHGSQQTRLAPAPVYHPIASVM